MMKKIILSLFALFAMGESLMAQKIDVPDVYASPGQTVAFTMHLSEGQADKYIALQFKAQFPATGFSTVKTNGFIVSDSWPGANAVINDLDDTGLVTIPFDCTNAIQGSKVDYLISIKFKVANNLTAGDYDVTLKDIELQYRENEVTKADKPADVTFKVKVQDKDEAEVTLDENSPLVPEEAEDVKIRVFRTIEAGKWSTICLPFKMTANQRKAAFGDDVEVRRLTAYEKNGDNITLTFGTTLTGNMVATKPYIIKTSSNIKSFDVTSSISVSSPKETIWDDPDEENEKYAEFTGINKAGVVVPEDNLFINNNEFWFSKGKTITKAFRGYFWAKDAVSSAPVLMVFDNEATGISTVKSEKANNTVYNLNGQRIANPQKGLFIKGGKKVVIK
jgi:hypothetical protein